MSCLKVDNLNYRYGKKEVLKNISFEVNEGVVGILGADGEDRTTAVRLLAALSEIQGGDIFLNGLNYKSNLKEVRKSIGYIPQFFSVYGHLTGREFLQMEAGLRSDGNNKNIRNQIDEIVAKLSMQEFIHRKVKLYSDAMRQKLGIAKVLMGDPGLIIVDEPTVGLAPEQRNAIRELFPVMAEGKIVLVTTHIAEDIEQYCNYLLVIKDGELIYKGTKERFINEAEGLLWESRVNHSTYSSIKASAHVIAASNSKESISIKYISGRPLTGDSIRVKVNLQDAYLIHNMKLSM
ncbi:MAG: ABC transporter ATP-binding protein [Clostridiaceae bacterium]